MIFTFTDKDIPYKKLHPSSDKVNFPNARLTSGLDDEAIAELAASIQANGLINRLTVWENPEGDYIVIGGNRRYIAIGTLKDRERIFPNGIPCRCVSSAATLSDARKIAFADNLHRKALSIYEIVKELHNLRMNHSRTDRPMQLKDLAKAVNKSISWVGRYIRVFDSASPNVHVAWSKGSVPDSTILTLVETAPNDHAKQDELLEKYSTTAETGKRTDIAVANAELKKAKENKEETQKEIRKEIKKEKIQEDLDSTEDDISDDEIESASKDGNRAQVVARVTLYCDKVERQDLLKEVELVEKLSPDKVTEYAQGYRDALKLAFNQMGWKEGDRDTKWLPIVRKVSK